MPSSRPCSGQIVLLPFIGFVINGVVAFVAPERKSITSAGRLRSSSARVRDCARQLRPHAGRRPARARHRSLLHLDVCRQPAGRSRLPARSALDPDDADHHGRRLPDPRVQRRLHAGRPRLPALLRVPQPVRVLHAGAGAGRELPGDVRGLGRRRPLLLPADRLLVQRQGERGRGQEGVHREPHRRLRLPGRDVHALQQSRHARFRGRVRCRARHVRCRQRSRHGDHALPVSRRDRQERADPALHLAARRDGGPDARERADPRRDDGDGRRLPGRALVRAVRAGAHDDDRGRGHRRAHRAVRRDDRAGAVRHQEGARVFHRVAARLHVPWRGRRRVHGRACSTC